MKISIPVTWGEYKQHVDADGNPYSLLVVKTVTFEPLDTGCDPRALRLTLPEGVSSVMLPRDLFSDEINRKLDD